MNGDISVAPPATVAAPARRRVFTIENRFLPPILITSILLAAHLSFGVLESYQRTVLARLTQKGIALVEDSHEPLLRLSRQQFAHFTRAG